MVVSTLCISQRGVGVCSRYEESRCRGVGATCAAWAWTARIPCPEGRAQLCSGNLSRHTCRSSWRPTASPARTATLPHIQPRSRSDSCTRLLFFPSPSHPSKLQADRGQAAWRRALAVPQPHRVRRCYRAGCRLRHGQRTPHSPRRAPGSGLPGSTLPAAGGGGGGGGVRGAGGGGGGRSSGGGARGSPGSGSASPFLSSCFSGSGPASPTWGQYILRPCDGLNTPPVWFLIFIDISQKSI